MSPRALLALALGALACAAAGDGAARASGSLKDAARAGDGAAPGGKAAARPFAWLRDAAPLLDGPASALAALPAADRRAFYERAAAAYTAARNHSAAARARGAAVDAAAAEAAAAGPAAASAAARDVLLARVALAEAAKAAGDYAGATRALRDARAAVAASGTGAAGAGLVAGLWRAEAEVLRCAGGPPEKALAAWARGAPGGDAEWPRAGARLATLADTNLALDYWRLLASTNAQPAARARVASALIAAGPWERAEQLPRRFSRGLAAAPWHDPDAVRTGSGGWAALRGLAAALRAAAPALVAEYTALPRGLLLQEAECIADAARGEWRYMTVNAPWVEEIDADGCSVATPAACALLRAARAAGLDGDALRGTYSAVAGGARLRPHCGVTNSQLKFHLGLIVPTFDASPRDATAVGAELSADGAAAPTAGGAAALGADGAAAPRTPCATMTVAGEPRAWTAGGVLLFDDSFVHEVANVCPNATRVVFQLVIPHPDVPAARRFGAAPGGD
jgi:hypothetical protein